MKLRLFAILFSLVALSGASWFAVHMYAELIDVTLSFHGRLAMTLGIVVSLAIGIGLMALVFYSARHGHDDI